MAETDRILLLRGVNVGGRNKLPMAALRAEVEAFGANDVRTIIQSGNVCFRSTQAVADKLARELAERLLEAHGVTTPVVLLTAAEVRAALDGWPFEHAEEKRRHLGFLQRAPASDAIAGLDPERSPGDEFLVRARVVYLHLPNGVARTKLTNQWFDRQLGTVVTVRNWKTSTRLC
jgi:uncharacterized protein (DUF1697 family)